MTTAATAGREVTYLEAISQALDEEMARDERVFLMGEDIGPYGGGFRVTGGVPQKYGEGGGGGAPPPPAPGWGVGRSGRPGVGRRPRRGGGHALHLLLLRPPTT